MKNNIQLYKQQIKDWYKNSSGWAPVPPDKVIYHEWGKASLLAHNELRTEQRTILGKKIVFIVLLGLFLYMVFHLSMLLLYPY